jgi:hypothetical protein
MGKRTGRQRLAQAYERAGLDTPVPVPHPDVAANRAQMAVLKGAQIQKGYSFGRGKLAASVKGKR